MENKPASLREQELERRIREAESRIPAEKLALQEKVYQYTVDLMRRLVLRK